MTRLQIGRGPRKSELLSGVCVESVHGNSRGDYAHEVAQGNKRGHLAGVRLSDVSPATMLKLRRQEGVPRAPQERPPGQSRPPLPAGTSAAHGSSNGNGSRELDAELHLDGPSRRSL